MDSTLTIRMDSKQRKRLRQAAAKQGKSDSEWTRQVIERSLDERPMGQRVGHLKGCLSGISEPDDALAQSIRENNWRSDCAL